MPQSLRVHRTKSVTYTRFRCTVKVHLKSSRSVLHDEREKDTGPLKIVEVVGLRTFCYTSSWGRLGITLFRNDIKPLTKKMTS